MTLHGHIFNNLNDEEANQQQINANNMGARKYTDANGKVQYDYSGVGHDLAGQNGLNYATQGYDYSGADKAMGLFGNPTQLTQTYAPTTQSYGTLGAEYGNMAYNTGAANSRREAQGQLEQQREAIGTRRPGLLMRQGEANERNLGETLGGLNNNIAMETMRQNIQNKIAEQQANAQEAYKGYQSRADLEKANADNAYRNAQGLGEMNLNKVTSQAGLTAGERGYQQGNQELQNKYFQGNVGLNDQAIANYEQAKNAKRGATLGFMGDVAGATGQAAQGRL